MCACVCADFGNIRGNVFVCGKEKGLKEKVERLENKEVDKKVNYSVEKDTTGLERGMKK